MIGIFYVGSHKVKSICCCQERKELVLLGLIIQDLGFWFPRAKHRWVSQWLANCCEVLFNSKLLLQLDDTSCTRITPDYLRPYSKSLWQAEGILAVKNERLLTFQGETVFWHYQVPKQTTSTTDPLPSALRLLFHSAALTLALAQTGVSLRYSGWQWYKPGTGSELNRLQWRSGWTPWSRRSACH